MLVAAEILHELRIPLSGDILFSTVVDEEIGGMGTLAMVDRGYHADAGILTEPTNNRISPVCHGILWGKIILNGIGGHAELARRHWDAGGPVDAIGLTRFVLSGIDVINERWRTDPRKNHPLMELPNQIIVTQIKAGEHPSSAAGRSEIIIDVQYLPHEKDIDGVGGSVKREVEEHITRISQVDPWLAEHPPRIEWILDADCAEVTVDHPIIAAFRDASQGGVASVRALGNRRAHRHGNSNRSWENSYRQLRAGRPESGASAQRVCVACGFSNHNENHRAYYRKMVPLTHPLKSMNAKVLLVGESWVSSSTHVKGFDFLLFEFLRDGRRFSDLRSPKARRLKSLIFQATKQRRIFRSNSASFRRLMSSS